MLGFIPGRELIQQLRVLKEAFGGLSPDPCPVWEMYVHVPKLGGAAGAPAEAPGFKTADLRVGWGILPG